MTTSASTGRKDDQGKPDWNLMPWRQLTQVQDVLDYGAAKYGPENWKEVSNPKTRYRAALVRHVVAYMCGELDDDESGLHHLAHAICCALFLLHFEDADYESTSHV